MKKALFVIDVQKIFINDFTKEIPAKIKGYLLKNKEKYDFLIFTKFINKPTSNFFKQLKWRKCTVGNKTEIVAELRQFINKKNLFEKNTYSAFKCRRVLNFIKKNGIKKIYLCGLNTDACILASAFDGFDMGFEIRILKKLTNTYWGPEKFNDWVIKLLGYKIDPHLLKQKGS